MMNDAGTTIITIVNSNHRSHSIKWTIVTDIPTQYVTHVHVFL